MDKLSTGRYDNSDVTNWLTQRQVLQSVPQKLAQKKVKKDIK